MIGGGGGGKGSTHGPTSNKNGGGEIWGKGKKRIHRSEPNKGDTLMKRGGGDFPSSEGRTQKNKIFQQMEKGY